MKLGRLRERVTIERKAVARSATGAESVTWAPLDTVWADVRAERGDERLAGAQLGAVADIRVWIHYRADFDEEARIVWRGQAYDVVYMADPDGRGRALEIHCRKGVRGGR